MWLAGNPAPGGASMKKTTARPTPALGGSPHMVALKTEANHFKQPRAQSPPTAAQTARTRWFAWLRRRQSC